jgi:hypothetical protein
MFKIVAIFDTDYSTSDNREELQAIVGDLNADAIDADVPHRWTVIEAAIWQSLQEVKS